MCVSTDDGQKWSKQHKENTNYEYTQSNINGGKLYGGVQ